MLLTFSLNCGQKQPFWHCSVILLIPTVRRNMYVCIEGQLCPRTGQPRTRTKHTEGLQTSTKQEVKRLSSMEESLLFRKCLGVNTSAQEHAHGCAHMHTHSHSEVERSGYLQTNTESTILHGTCVKGPTPAHSGKYSPTCSLQPGSGAESPTPQEDGDGGHRVASCLLPQFPGYGF